MKKEKDKFIPLKNYIYVIFMFFITGLLVFGIRAWYRNYKDYQLQKPFISGKIQQIDIEDINEYIMEHDNFFMYIGIAPDENCREIEKNLEEILKNRNIKDDTIYINMSEIPNDKKKLQEKLKNIGFDYNNANYPMFMIIRDKKIASTVYKKDYKLNIGDIEQLLDENEIGD